jgi:(5-formylfuran-3-yl)methyl phosphate synthase
MTGDLSKKRESSQPRSVDPMLIVSRLAVPRLLISVRSRTEADCALAAGVDILDVKEPSLGSLGMARIDDITEIATAADIVSGKIPLSVALGEISDWTDSGVFPQLPHGVMFAKLGLSGCAADPNWQAEWLRVRAGFQLNSSSKLRWVAVAYADASGAKSPCVLDVLSAAIETDCAGLLIDTFTKDGRRLNDEIDESLLFQLADNCHEAGLFLALAGRLNYESLPFLKNANADVIGIRSAACRGSDRTLQLDTARITEFQNEIRRCFGAKALSN